MLLGPAPDPAERPVAFPIGTALPLIAGLVAVAALGVTLGPVTGLLQAAAAAAGAP